MRQEERDHSGKGENVKITSTSAAPEEPNVGFVEALGEHASNPPNPRTVGDTVQALGHVWTVADDECRVKAQFEQWVRFGARAAAQDAYNNGDPEEASKLRSQYAADFGASLYNWGAKHVMDALRDIPGMQYFFYLLLLRCQPNVTEVVAKAIWKDNTAGCIEAVAWALGNLQSLSRKDLDGEPTGVEIAKAAIRRSA